MKRNIKKVLRKMKTREAMDKRQAKKGNNQQPQKENRFDDDFYYEDYEYEE